MYEKRDNSKDETFLALKYGSNYVTKIMHAWHDGEQLTEAEHKICFDYLRRLAGLPDPIQKEENGCL